ncbi:proliferating cell nuclear antigen [Pancytospora epiphaga]|nr:proliferating cell nuclear antigen [Pancytospora epiphaga]
MFELEIENTADNKGFASERIGMLRKIVDCLSDFRDQMTVRVTNKGLTIQIMDSSHAAMIDIFMSGEMFSKFRCDREILLGIEIKTFQAVLRNLTLDDSSLLKMSSEDTPDKLLIEYSADNSKYEAILCLRNVTSDCYTLPNIDYHSVVRMPSEQFRTISRNVGAFGEYISLSVDKEQMIFEQVGDKIKNAMTIASDRSSVTVDSVEPVKIEVGMKYINMINKISSLSTKLTVSLEASVPVFFEIKLCETLGQICMYVAPKADN